MTDVLASKTSETFTPDSLLAGPGPYLSEKIVLITGENRTRGAVLGRVAGAISAPAAFAGNTGNGTFAATPTAGAGIKEGDYKMVCIEPATNLGKFELTDPDGNLVEIATVGTAFAGPLNFTLNDGATDFVVGDGFTITVAVGTKYKLAASAATDGSHRPRAILALDIDATAADKEALSFYRGQFNEKALVLGAGITVAAIRADLRAQGIDLIPAQGA